MKLIAFVIPALSLLASVSNAESSKAVDRTVAQASDTVIACASPSIGCLSSKEQQVRTVKNANSIRAMSTDQQHQLAIDLGLVFPDDKNTTQFRGPLLAYNGKSCGSAAVVAAHASMIESAIYQVQNK